jgi:pseudouridine kinase
MTSNRNVVVVGAANLDILGFPVNTLIPRDSNPGRVKFHPGGVGRNIAENLARMGVQTMLITAVGEAFDGSFIIESCRKSGVDTRAVIRTGAESASAYLAIMDSGGDMALAVSDMEASAEITPRSIEERKQLLRSAAMIVADANLPAETLEYLAAISAGVPLVVDPVSVTKAERVRPILGSIHTLKLNRLEAGALAGRDTATRDGLRHAGAFFRERGVKNTFITLGDEGVYWNCEAGDGLFRCARIEPVNATGAGDAFTAAIVDATLREYPVETMLRHAAAAARIALGCEAAVNPGMNRQLLEESRSAAGEFERFGS